jgi:YHS domain-containing protein
MVRIVLLIVLFILIARTFWRFVDNIIDAAAGRPSRHSPGSLPSGVKMVRDPVCGTFIVRDGALAITDGRSPVYFCSELCRMKFRARREGRPA